MKKTMLNPIMNGLLILMILLVGGSAMAQDTTELNFQWTAPTTGSAVDHYVVQHSVNGGNWTQVATTSSTSYTLTATYGDAHRIRVAAVDADDRQGVYSASSDSVTPDAGAPGQPGKPILF